ncbi:hypothetical protein ABGB12_14890 [Actinocorallia sp. B10E7]|uniref:hypothetical protein n=1 Tax=Actinocorallia sp. B10E7 TaxID=3153558 RepID=UPI00325E998F
MTRAPSRHGKPRSAAKRLLDRLVDARRKTLPVLVLAAVVLAAAGFAVYQRPGESTAGSVGDRKPSAKRSAVPTLAVTDLLSEGDGDPDADPHAEARLREEAPEHLESVRWSGDFLRVYTDLDEGDTRHPAARELCETAVEYLKDTYSETYEDDDPVVFVHARRSGNGHVVLVNSVTGPCRSVETR